MLKPSIDDLLGKINSKFALTIVVAKRARQLQLAPDDYKIVEPVGRANNEVAKALEELNADELEFYLDRESMLEAQEQKREHMDLMHQDVELEFNADLLIENAEQADQSETVE